MSTPFISDYLKVVEATVDVPANPVTDPGTSPEMIAFCFDAEAGALTFWDPINEVTLTVLTTGGSIPADEITYDNGGSGLSATNLQDAVDEIAGLTAGNIAVEDEGIELTPSVTRIDFAGAGVTATEPVANEVLVTVPGYTDEQAQDAVGNILDDGGDIDFTYDDATPKITAAIKTGIVTNAMLANAAAWSLKIRNAGTSGVSSDAALADITTAVPVSGDFSVGFLSTGEIRKFNASNFLGLKQVAEIAGDGTTDTMDTTAIIPAGSLMVVTVYGRSTAGSTPGVNINLRFNNDSGSNYDNHQTQWQSNGAPGTNAVVGQTSLTVGFAPWSAATANYYGNAVLLVPLFANTGAFKNYFGGGGAGGSNSLDTSYVSRVATGHWRSTAAITRVQVLVSAGFWTTTSRLEVYVI